MKKKISSQLVSFQPLHRRIFILREQRVMLSVNLARLYGVEPRVLVQSVKRNINRFPSDFMFQLTHQEVENLKSQFVISSWGGVRRATLYAFTVQGIAMLSSVLNSRRAIQVNIGIMRAFVRLREMVVNQSALTTKLLELEGKISKHDKDIKIIFESIYELTDPARLKGTVSSSL